jgi:hypothetical protein
MKRLWLLICFVSSAAFGEIISISNPNEGFFHPKEDTQTIYLPNPTSKAVLIFIPGGTGSYETSPGKPERDRFSMLTPIAKGDHSGPKLDFVFMDSPYVLSPYSKNNLGPRGKKDHIDRIKSVIKFYSKKTGKPIWLIGHSNGAYSLASFLNQSPENQKLIVGTIFSGSRDERDLKGEFNLPILIIHHEADPCHDTSYRGAKSFYEDAQKQNKSKTEFVAIVGGTSSDRACSAGLHMYSGSEDQFTESVVKFISQN